MPSSLVTGPSGSAFQYQHDARFTSGGISLYDNAGIAPPPNGGPYGAARGLVLNLDVQNHRATLANPPYTHTPAFVSNSQGNFQSLGNGNVFVGWGSESQPGGSLGSSYTEYSSSGSVLADFSLAGQDISYRAESHPWVGIPLTKPGAAAAQANGQTTVFASWNGSTQTVAWAVLAGPSRNSLAPVASATRTGFETAITTTAPGPFFEVIAIGPGNVALKSSAVIRV
jgi:hypothetical protein